ncbi:hypothetical protein RvY_06521 [Ramazzottius varieornatus]|uniref:Uncharacterized protein n=1 Tax=Ramazzottius varieornatus TaxID=947166 RepID=A0A1D1UYW3_RAMVA|nr:hypothetical protein RvY_06521 [Ramazzottius varieornatus]
MAIPLDLDFPVGLLIPTCRGFTWSLIPSFKQAWKLFSPPSRIQIMKSSMASVASIGISSPEKSGN